MNVSTKAHEILDALRSELKKEHFDDENFAPKLLSLKVIARNPRDAPSVYCEPGLAVLVDTAFGSRSPERPKSRLEAARVIANALLLQDRLQQIFAKLASPSALVEFYQSDNPNYEFVGARILFLLTYKSQVDFSDLIKSHYLVDHINAHVRLHASGVKDGSFTKDNMNQMALVETLKLLYNLATKCPKETGSISSTLEVLIDLICKIDDVPARPLDPPISQLLNALAIMEWSEPEAATICEATLMLLCKRLIHILEQATLTLQPALLETMLVPLLTILRNICHINNSSVDQELKHNLLPRDEERDQPLGRSTSLAARLLQLQTSAGLTILPEAISALLFDLSGQDAKQFIHNIGYGHAAGYLMTHQIPIPQDLETVSTGENGSEGLRINPITGQRLDAEESVPVPPMTEEEREREAQKMFVLFERMKATGVVDIENPLRTAQQSGRLEELSDSDPD